MSKATSISAAILKMAIIADAQIGNSEKEMFKILVKFDHTSLPDALLLFFPPAVLCVVATIKYEETGNDSDDLRVPSALEELIGEAFDLTF